MPRERCVRDRVWAFVYARCLSLVGGDRADRLADQRPPAGNHRWYLRGNVAGICGETTLVLQVNNAGICEETTLVFAGKQCWSLRVNNAGICGEQCWYLRGNNAGGRGEISLVLRVNNASLCGETTLVFSGKTTLPVLKETSLEG